MVAGENQKVFRSEFIDKINVLGDRVCSAAVNIELCVCLFTRGKDVNTAVLRIESPASANGYIAVQKYGLVLCQDANDIDAAMEIVAGTARSMGVTIEGRAPKKTYVATRKLQALLDAQN